MVHHITYKEEKLPIRLSYRVFKGLKTDLGKENLENITGGEGLDPELMETMLWHGLISGHKHEDKEMKFKKEDMEDVLDECMFEFLKLIPLFFPKAKLGGKLGNALANLDSQEEQQTE